MGKAIVLISVGGGPPEEPVVEALVLGVVVAPLGRVVGALFRGNAFAQKGAQRFVDLGQGQGLKAVPVLVAPIADRSGLIQLEIDVGKGGQLIFIVQILVQIGDALLGKDRQQRVYLLQQAVCQRQLLLRLRASVPGLIGDDLQAVIGRPEDDAPAFAGALIERGDLSARRPHRGADMYGSADIVAVEAVIAVIFRQISHAVPQQGFQFATAALYVAAPGQPEEL